MAQRAEKGMWNGGIVPYGYKNIDKKLVINDNEAECVRKVFETFLETNSLAETRRRINLIYQTRKGRSLARVH